jgi:hypothetical protein
MICYNECELSNNELEDFYEKNFRNIDGDTINIF